MQRTTNISTTLHLFSFYDPLIMIIFLVLGQARNLTIERKKQGNWHYLVCAYCNVLELLLKVLQRVQKLSTFNSLQGGSMGGKLTLVP